MVKKVIYAIAGVLGYIIAFGAGIGVAVTSKVFAKFNDSDSLKDSITKADEALETWAKEELSEETVEEENN